ncbi:MAG TPA: septation protein A [Rickettsiales bacterium]|nr:septation protein A [Rickettsiales bacterium]
MSCNKKNEGWAKFLCDYLPLIVFIIVYKFSSAKNPILPATFYMIIVTFFSLIISYFLTKKIAKMPLFSGILLAIFGGLTLFSGDDLFIKIKPTLINLIFALILFFGYFSRRPLISHLFGSEMKMSAVAWHILSWRWAWFFVFLALLNEIVWRNFSTDFWVSFKMFGMFPITMIFTISQIPFIIKNVKKERE